MNVEKASPKISVVTPMYNEEENVEEFLKRTFSVLSILGQSHEVVCINDGSTDRTLELLREALKKYKGLVVVDLARNFGQHSAILAGFQACRGEWVITIDADLQNPPEEIPKIVKAFQDGHDLVGTIRSGREDSLFRKTASHMMNRFVRKISGIELQDFGCMLRGYSRELVHAILKNSEYRTFIPALAMLLAKNPIEIPIRHARRAAGQSKYSLIKLFSLQLDLMTGFSFWPLRVLLATGSFLAFSGIFFAVLIIVLRFILGPSWAVEGVFTLFAILFFFIGAQFFALGLIGEYIGRIFQAVRKRPLYIIRDIHYD